MIERININMFDDITLTKLNKQEGARYLGYGSEKPDDRIMKLIDECESEIIAAAKPRYIYKLFDIETTDEGVEFYGTNLILKGSSIKEHLTGCNRAACICATLSSDMDKLIKVTQVKDMAKAVIMDAFAGVAVEQVCDKIEEQIRDMLPDKYLTYRFGIGYGDLPLEQMGEFLAVLGTSKTIGVTVTGGTMMSPTKSVACIVGISDNQIKSKKKGCITCNMREKCQFRVKGERCGF